MAAHEGKPTVPKGHKINIATPPPSRAEQTDERLTALERELGRVKARVKSLEEGAGKRSAPPYQPPQL